MCLVDNNQTTQATTPGGGEPTTTTSPRRAALPPPSPKFTVSYCRKCDGGQEEMISAVECVRDIFPRSAVKTTVVRDRLLPANVLTISMDVVNDKDHIVWTGEQSNLGSRFPRRRKKAMDLIKTNLADLRERIHF